MIESAERRVDARAPRWLPMTYGERIILAYERSTLFIGSDSK